uniref:HhH-GPD domain-containing protein n=1 Tax=Salix viminalis TaxID=40686 RepID=A0A6N2MDM4_SALVM
MANPSLVGKGEIWWDSLLDFQLVHRWIGLKFGQQFLDTLIFILNGWIEDVEVDFRRDWAVSFLNLKKNIVNPLFVIVELFEWTTVMWFFLLTLGRSSQNFGSSLPRRKPNKSPFPTGGGIRHPAIEPCLKLLLVRAFVSISESLSSWPRTLSMARALCELQFDLQCKSSGVFGSQAANATVKNECNDTAHNFIQNKPAGKEFKRNIRASKVSKYLASKFVETKTLLEADAKLNTDSAHTGIEISIPSLSLERVEDDSCERCSSCRGSDSGAPDSLQSHNGIQPGVNKMIGNFPSPRELANLDESFLAKRCNLGYRAIRIIKLAQSIVEGRIPLREAEESCANGASSSLYNKLADQFRKIDGFGPFTCANVLMCMGFYHIIPTDSETVRHLKKVHAKKSTIQTVHRDVEVIYGKYAPFQFLAYWAELWHFYEKRFGKLSEMPPSDYKLITASNMRSKGGHVNKKTKRC